MATNTYKFIFVLLDAAPEESEPGYALAVFFGIGLIVGALYVQYKKDLSKELKGKVKVFGMSEITSIMASSDQVLSTYFPFYNALSYKGKEKFRSRIQWLLSKKTFVGKEGLDLEDAMILLAAGGFVQLTFGLKDYEIPRFYKIELYPSTFLDSYSKREFAGAMVKKGIVRMSWPHIERGFNIEDDGINLALHEFAHAFKYTIEVDQNDRILFKRLQLFLHESGSIRQRVNDGELKFFRKYASVNEHEFFACCIEVFFENAQVLKSELPDVYAALCELLNLDPSNVHDDFKLSHSVRSADSRIRIRNLVLPGPDREYNYMHTMMIIGSAFWFFVVALYSFVITSDWEVEFLFLLTLAIVGAIIFHRSLLVSGYTSIMTFTFFILMGWLPAASFVCGVVNWFTPVSFTTTDVKIIPHENSERTHFYISLEHPIPEDAKSVYKLNELQLQELRAGSADYYVRVHEYYGIFALKVYEGGELIRVQPALPAE